MPVPAPPLGSAAVVGGGPAGLMAAEVLATAGFRVHVYEHMPSVGRKLLLAGRSGLNLTNSEPLDDLLSRYGDAPIIHRAVSDFPPSQLRAWCLGLGEPTYTGSSGRVFPSSFRATPLLRSWLGRLDALGVQMHLRHRWLGWGRTADGSLDPLLLRFQPSGRLAVEVHCDVTVFALGGASWPRVGSDGGWVAPFRAAGLHVRALRPSNCGVIVGWTQRFTDRFAGTPLKNVCLAVGAHNARGDATITTTGLESGPVYTLSAAVRDRIERDGSCTMVIDLHPDLTTEVVRRRLGARRPKDSLATALRRTLGLAPVAVALLREATDNRPPTGDEELARLVKAVPITIRGVASIERAISTAGGLALTELDEHFMVRALPGTFVAGEMLDWEAPTGGYLLQASFSSAVAAATGAVDWRVARR
ncbi:MAG: TIGR03862 family flavoprotein [Ilumatobacteraceae bacterium]